MDIKYEIRTIKNAKGNGGEQKYVRLQQPNLLSANEIEQEIEHSSTLTNSDVRAVFAALHQLMVRELGYGNRVFLPGIGYFTLSAELGNPKVSDSDHKITGKEVFLSGINFRPVKDLYKEVEKEVRFVKAKTSSKSADYAEDDLWQKIDSFLSAKRYITVRDMRSEFALSRYMAEKWLKLFTDKGMLIKSGSSHYPLYFKA